MTYCPKCLHESREILEGKLYWCTDCGTLGIDGEFFTPALVERILELTDRVKKIQMAAERTEEKPG